MVDPRAVIFTWLYTSALESNELVIPNLSIFEAEKDIITNVSCHFINLLYLWLTFSIGLGGGLHSDNSCN